MIDTNLKMASLHQAKDYKSDQYVRWCPGCGDHAILNCLHKAMAELDIEPHMTAVISGIGCSSRLPYYMNTYGFHTIHGRGAAIATGVKTAKPELTVWLATGDGDSLAIGGNHFIHAVRRNVDINILLFNNKIYGLTKGQFSPTSDRGFVSKTSPYGTVEDPFHPIELALGARGTFFARCIDVDLSNTTEVLADAARHKGASVIEVLQNCVIFNDAIHENVADKAWRAERTILLKQGEKMLFGANKDKGLVMDGWNLKAVTVGQEGYTIDDVLVHDSTTEDNTLHLKLGLMSLENGLPVALGVIRDVKALTYDEGVAEQIKEVQAKNPIRSLRDYLMTKDVWEVK
ncbi:2-oxoglutarate ferredoxin oxidoreductase subunit beta [Dysgonomonas sp. PFB1-18]|uniref:2-oxoacid:ferredoxin oxidoreductase subunit beta n=1 Tax=unclassified Dysgonomonas TaxID=2630389 RepID=UPI0024767A40|nr:MULTISPECIES: 2-oxoacid:ferredoxin oxidoreductase subunit beta [unclassified Dysgonomonas]MDH6309709.1 2-oxoglutarate ferredoxin oxidoreductase subunit beta [Dysgonomonas sp. PF1-14]MDH6339283.1 2-oxoglutarate ferredoxin oxidoreductase subunit beta [Dysgonomonas sp. PF1-16]MDH6380782.1 2-oxoglutarate ferredoxin oxidoreductase subunit beta [Dysgonomonas sp. PFB1-18]MDH6398278.1 2-oxoglutarate ferredoxin oxidoreductase subunit beta [Dysgonomonas sp. PF1-23]